MEYKLGKHRVRSGDVISSGLASVVPEIVLHETTEYNSVIFTGPGGTYYAVYDVANGDHVFTAEMTSDPDLEWYRYPENPGVYRMRLYSHSAPLANRVARVARNGRLSKSEVDKTKRLIESRARLVESIVFIVVDRPDVETRFCRCLIKVSKSSSESKINPYAVCHHSVKPGGTVKCGLELAGLVRDPEIPIDFIVAYMQLYNVEIPPNVTKTRDNLLWLIEQKKFGRE